MIFNAEDRLEVWLALRAANCSRNSGQGPISGVDPMQEFSQV